MFLTPCDLDIRSHGTTIYIYMHIYIYIYIPKEGSCAEILGLFKANLFLFDFVYNILVYR